MRAGGCTVQQALTAEAAGMVKEAVSLARRRGNAQVTPLHVASAMLASPSGLLRAACLRSHSHPLQCKALELCFNVALNRLPASAAVSPLLGHAHHGHHYYPPSLSNALVAAFKRAQAHQRRGSVESQQQPVLAVKIELEQLVISILDDPSVSRVMREAGFSSTQVKANVEQAVSSSVDGNHCSTTTATIAQNPNPNPTAITTTPPVQETKPKLPLDPVKEEDVTTILDYLAGKSKRRIMVVAECATTTEAAVRAAVEKIKRGEARHEALRSVQLVNLTVSRFWDLPREDADRRLAELRCLVRSMRGAVLLVVEDLRWAAEFWARHVEKGRRSYYCAVEHAITEVRALACGGGDGPWLVGFGTYETYMRYCRAGHPSLETMWGLQTLAVPTGSLALSLSCVDDSALAVNHQSMKARCDDSGNGPSSCWLVLDSGGSCSRRAIPGCCGDCAAAKSMPLSSSLPSWLRHGHDQEPAHLSDLCKKWSSICSPPCHWMTLNLSSVVSPSTSVPSYEHGHLHHEPYHPWLLADLEADDAVRHGAKVDSKSHDSGASNGTVEVECRSRFKELTAENLKLLCGALEKEVPWQKEVIPKIVSTVLRCRSGMAKRHDNSRSAEVEEETWLLFLGGDTDGKVRVAKELARLVFGSHSNFLSIGLNASTSSRFDSSEERRSKLSRPKASQGYLDRLYEAVRDKPHQVILMEDIEHASRHCQVGIKEAIESGVVRSHDGDEVGLGDAIVVLSCESIDARSRVCSPPPTKRMKAERDQELEEKENAASDHREAEVNSSSPACFDLNLGVEKEAEECCLSDVGLLEAVDRTLFFRIPEEGL